MRADAFATVGNGFAGADRPEDAHRAWESAYKLMIDIRAKYPVENHHEFDEHIDPLAENLGIDPDTRAPREASH